MNYFSLQRSYRYLQEFSQSTEVKSQIIILKSLVMSLEINDAIILRA